jgi:hypothetical protein
MYSYSLSKGFDLKIFSLLFCFLLLWRRLIILGRRLFWFDSIWCGWGWFVLKEWILHFHVTRLRRKKDNRPFRTKYSNYNLYLYSYRAMKYRMTDRDKLRMLAEITNDFDILTLSINFAWDKSSVDCALLSSYNLNFKWTSLDVDMEWNGMWIEEKFW